MTEFAKGGTVCGKNVILGSNIVETIIPNKKPTIKGLEDIVNVVRCKDCKHWKKGEFKGGDTKENLEWGGGCPLARFARYESDFCSRGERREGE